MSRFRLGAVPIDPLARDETLDSIRCLVSQGTGGTVFTPNVDHIVLADRDSAFREAYQQTRLSIVDGMPVLWMARLLGCPVPEKVSGSDLVWPLARHAAANGWPVYLFGSAPGVAERATEILRAEIPRLLIAGFASPLVDMCAPSTDRLATYEAIRRSGARIVLVALGSPKGELWANEARESLAPAVIVCVGAALDFLTGAQRRAPRWMSSAGLEWLYRLAFNPRRLAGRYLLRGPLFIPIVLRGIFSSLLPQGRLR